MKYAVSAVAALALGIGLAASAQAHGTYNRQSAIPGTDMQAGTSAPVQQAAPTVRHKAASRHQVMKTQRMLKAQGFYQGRITGIMDAKTRFALKQWRQEHRVASIGKRTKMAGLQKHARFAKLQKPARVASLHKATRTRHNVAVGSSTPNPNMQNTQNMSGSTTPPANQTPSAGGNNDMTNQDMNR